MWGFSTHVSDPNSSTTCTTALKNIPKTLGLVPSLPRILVSRAYLFYAFLRLTTTAGQFLSATTKIHPRYLKEVTFSSGLT